MAEYFARGLLRFVNGEWRDDNGDAIEISRVRHGRWVKAKLKKDYWVFDSDGDFGCLEDYPILCSSCNYDLTENGSIETNYCPNCGCRMDLEDNA